MESLRRFCIRYSPTLFVVSWLLICAAGMMSLADAINAGLSFKAQWDGFYTALAGLLGLVQLGLFQWARDEALHLGQRQVLSRVFRYRKRLRTDLGLAEEPDDATNENPVAVGTYDDLCRELFVEFEREMADRFGALPPKARPANNNPRDKVP